VLAATCSESSVLSVIFVYERQLCIREVFGHHTSWETVLVGESGACAHLLEAKRGPGVLYSAVVCEEWSCKTPANKFPCLQMTLKFDACSGIHDVPSPVSHDMHTHPPPD
jgi:hypothetical protein